MNDIKDAIIEHYQETGESNELFESLARSLSEDELVSSVYYSFFASDENEIRQEFGDELGNAIIEHYDLHCRG